MNTATALTEFEQNFHLGYPHANSFGHGGQTFILGQRNKDRTSLWEFDSISLKNRLLCDFPIEPQPEKMLWSDTAFTANVSITIADNCLWILPSLQSESLKKIYQAPSGYRLHPIPGIHPNGKEIAVGLYGPDTFEALSIETETGKSKVLFQKNFQIDHFHFCYHDPSWIGFSHEGNCATTLDRVWAWHVQEAPEGKCVFEQYASDPKRTINAGHERWSFHDCSVLIVAYGEGPGTPRGIYEAFTDGRPQKLISEGNRDFHLDVSRDGRWVVVDTTGPHDLPGKGWENAGNISDVLVLDRANGERRFVHRSHLSHVTKHPSHAHPVFSPDGTYVLFNEANETGELNRVWRAPNPFLKA